MTDVRTSQARTPGTAIKAHEENPRDVRRGAGADGNVVRIPAKAMFGARPLPLPEDR